MSKWTAFRYITLDSKRHGRRVEVRVDLEFDLDEIAYQLGKKAFANKNGKSKMAIGIKADARLAKKDA